VCLRYQIVPVLTRCTIQLNRSKRDRRARRSVPEASLRMRAVRLTYDHLATVELQWSTRPWLTTLPDSVAAGLLPHPHRCIGLILPQRLARWTVVGSNPSASEAPSLEDF
jgi:hypothetical protein